MLTRRSFLEAVAGAAAMVGLAGCAAPVRSDSPSARSGDDGGTDSLVGPDDSASEGLSPDVRELVRDEPGVNEARGLDNSHVSPDPATVEGTVLTARVVPGRQQCLYLWEEGNVPAVTSPSSTGSDPAGFRPTVTSVPAAEGTPIKGALLLCAGGAFAIRADNADAYPTARAFSELGYRCFVVDYRLRPYTQQEGGVDLARAIRFVRAHAADYGLPDENCIAVAGFSAGGIQCGETLINWKGDVTPDALDPAYEPDELDRVSADATADAMVYSFYGRLSVASRDAELLSEANLPPTFYCYGTEDPFYDQFEMQVGLMADLGYDVHARVLDSWPHGFGALGGWVPEFDAFMQRAFGRA